MTTWTQHATHSLEIHGGNRRFNPATGTFIAQDTNSYLDNPATGNPCAYTGDDPVNYTGGE